MKQTKIDWCDSTWNPITGCFHDCEYCYARGIAHRFGLPFAPKLGDPGMKGAAKWDSSEGMDTMLELEKPYKSYEGKHNPYPMGFNPTFHRYKLDEPQRWKKPRNIFVCSMADLFGKWVPNEWIKAVFTACEKAPQHNYIFLTKNPKRYMELQDKGLLPDKHWYGYTATKESEIWHCHHADECNIKNLFISIEPIQESIDLMVCSHYPADWIIVGAETGNRKGKVKPEKNWIDKIAINYHYGGYPIFMKESLCELMGEDFVQEFPEGLRKDG